MEEDIRAQQGSAQAFALVPDRSALARALSKSHATHL
jgi:hypothetical protein